MTDLTFISDALLYLWPVVKGILVVCGIVFLGLIVAASS